MSTDTAKDVSFYRPTFSRLLVLPDRPADIARSYGLHAPDSARRERPTSGKIVAAGWDVPADFRIGRRVVFGPFAGMVKRIRGREYMLMETSAVQALTDGEEDEEDPLGVSWKGHLRPPPSQYLIERVEMPRYAGVLILPDSALEDVRSSEALVVASPAVTMYEYQMDRFPTGTRVFLMGTVSRFIPLGRNGEVTLSVCYPTDFSAILSDDPGEAIQTAELDHLRAAGEFAASRDRTGSFEEGDPRARR